MDAPYHAKGIWMRRDDEDGMAARAGNLELARAPGLLGPGCRHLRIVALDLAFWAMSDRGAPASATDNAAVTTRLRARHPRRQTDPKV